MIGIEYLLAQSGQSIGDITSQIDIGAEAVAANQDEAIEEDRSEPLPQPPQISDDGDDGMVWLLKERMIQY